VTLTQPAAGCRDLAFRHHAGYAVGEAGEVALHLCDVGEAWTAAVAADIEDFARDLAEGAGTDGLGWS